MISIEDVERMERQLVETRRALDRGQSVKAISVDERYSRIEVPRPSIPTKKGDGIIVATPVHLASAPLEGGVRASKLRVEMIQGG